MKQSLIYQYIENNILNIDKIIIEYNNYVYKTIRNVASNLSNEDIEEIVVDVFLIEYMLVLKLIRTWLQIYYI